MTFGQINGPLDPEEFSWEVSLGEGQELEAIDAQHAQVFYTEGHLTALVIEARPAHDAQGATVPTTLAVSAGNVITLTVHHRAGNPAAAGAPFAYPVSGGTGWEGGFQTFTTSLSEPQPSTPAPISAPTPICTVPKLIGKSVKAGRKQLVAAGCMLGKVRGQRSKAAKVVKQDLKPGAVLAVGSKVGVKLAG